jgi:hypothetical protein
VLADERLRVEVVEVEFAELGPRLSDKSALALSARRRIPQRLPGLRRHPGQLLGPEDHQADERQNENLCDGEIKHKLLPRSCCHKLR